MRKQKRRTYVDRENFVPLLGRDVFHIGGCENTRIVDEQIDLTKALQDIFDRIPGVFRPAKVALERKRLNTGSFYLLQRFASFVRGRSSAWVSSWIG